MPRSRWGRMLFYFALAVLAYGVAMAFGNHGLAFGIFLIGGVIAEAAAWREVFFGGHRAKPGELPTD